MTELQLCCKKLGYASMHLKEYMSYVKCFGN